MQKRQLVGQILIFGAVVGCAPAESGDAEPVQSTDSAQTEAWDCYAPEPGHPTPAEKTAFITQAGKAALTAERTYGIPA